MTKQKTEQLNINDILTYLPHRYPFLLIDRIVEYTVGESIVAIKNVTFNEPHFNGHFPTRPIMPGVLIIEAIAQATGMLAFNTFNDLKLGKELFFLTGIDDVRFKRMVEPGDQLRIAVKVDRARRDIWRVKGEVTVEGETVCTATLMIARDTSK